MTNPIPPATSIRSIEDSEHRYEIFTLLCSRVSPERVAKILRTHYHEIIPVEDIRAYLGAIDIAFVIEEDFLTREKLKSLDIQIDAPTRLAKLIQLADLRLDALLQAEDLADTDAVRLSIQPAIDRAMGAYWKMLLDYVRTMQSMGELPSEPLKLSVEAVSARQEPGLRELLKPDRLPAPEEP